MVGAALLVTASGCAERTADGPRDPTKTSRGEDTKKFKTEDSALRIDREKCERAGGLWVNGFCELEGM
jgi:hypothetical protein